MNVDFAVLRGRLWPEAECEQASLLRGLRASSWQAHPHVNEFLAEGHFRQIATLSLATAFGQRWFDVWQPPQGGSVVLIKEPALADTLVVSCSLLVGSRGPTATFALLSGRVLASKTFPSLSSSRPLLWDSLLDTAFEEALRKGLLESSAQEVCLQLEGFTEQLPAGLLLCSDSTVTPAALQEWLSYLQTLTLHELAQWDFYYMAAPEDEEEETPDTGTCSESS